MIIEAISAAFDTKLINGPFPERGAIFLIAPSGHFKNTIIEAAIGDRSDVLQTSKLNGRQWNDVKQEFISNVYSAISLPEFENLYRGASSTADHIEAILQDVIAQGYTHGPGQDPRIPRMKARAFLIGGLTPKLFERHYKDWEEGFLRRSLWCNFSLKNPEEILKAIKRWEKIDLGRIYERPANNTIPMDISSSESDFLERLMRDQPSRYGTGSVLLKKMAAVLKWRYKKTKTPDHWREIIEEFSLCLQHSGALVALDKTT